MHCFGPHPVCPQVELASVAIKKVNLPKENAERAHLQIGTRRCCLRVVVSRDALYKAMGAADSTDDESSSTEAGSSRIPRTCCRDRM